MEVTGYQLREAVKQWELKKELCTKEFTSSLRVFEGEVKRKPEEIAKEVEQAELAIAHLQRCQALYNMVVKFDFNDQKITLCEAVKLAGGIARQEKLWRTALGESPSPFYDNLARLRDKNQVAATSTISEQQVAVYIKAASKQAATLKAGISAANGARVEIQDLDVQYMNI
jgi:hypothetical protein